MAGIGAADGMMGVGSKVGSRGCSKNVSGIYISYCIICCYQASVFIAQSKKFGDLRGTYSSIPRAG
jgi:hypothetical protein